MLLQRNNPAQIFHPETTALVIYSRKVVSIIVCKYMSILIHFINRNIRFPIVHRVIHNLEVLANDVLDLYELDGCGVATEALSYGKQFYFLMAISDTSNLDNY